MSEKVVEQFRKDVHGIIERACKKSGEEARKELTLEITTLRTNLHITSLELTSLRSLLSSAEKERDEWKRKYESDGVCEIGASNPNVASYCNYWEQRATAAEERARVAEERTLLMSTPCKCDPIGSGEEYCNGGCALRAELRSLRLSSIPVGVLERWCTMWINDHTPYRLVTGLRDACRSRSTNTKGKSDV